MAIIKTFKDLTVWQRAHQLVLTVYEVTRVFPQSELYGLVSQMRRSAVSVASNVVEGFSRNGIKDGLRFYSFSRASLEELKYQILVSFDTGLLDDNCHDRLILLSDEVGKLLNGWINSQIQFNSFNHNDI
jgi:four helix bundle protein